MKYDLAVFIGRFQPFHNGHLHVIQHALNIASRVLVLVGSATGTLRPRNPFSYADRAEMIYRAFPEASRLLISPLRDFMYREDRWIDGVQMAVKKITDGYSPQKITLIGWSKDESSYYLKRFPQWHSIDTGDAGAKAATEIRNALFIGDGNHIRPHVPEHVFEFLNNYLLTTEGKRLISEHTFIKDYKAGHDGGEFHRNNVTADAVVLQGGHVLLVKRKARPGKGLWALPGGHVKPKELPSDAAIRELMEETSIKVPEAVLRGSVVREHWFDDPYRSDLARTYTKATLIRLSHTALPKVKGADDAAEAQWRLLADLKENELFDDHWHIIDYFVGLP